MCVACGGVVATHLPERPRANLKLDAGVRFIDFRIVYSAPPHELSTAPHDWYCLHLMQSNNLAISYLTAARDWLLAHPKVQTERCLLLSIHSPVSGVAQAM